MQIVLDTADSLPWGLGGDAQEGWGAREACAREMVQSDRLGTSFGEVAVRDGRK